MSVEGHENGHSSNSNQRHGNKKYKEPLPIEEILFGIDRTCPLELLPDATAASLELDDESTRGSQSKSINGSDTTEQQVPDNSHSSLHSSSILSIHDDLSDGRWSAAAADATASSCRAYHHVINMADLRRTASQGIQDGGSHRAVAWRVLLSYLPIQLSEWKTVLQSQRSMYRNLVKELFVSQNQHLPHNHRNGTSACPLPTRSPLLQHDGNELRGHHSKKAKKRITQQQFLESDSEEQLLRQYQEQHDSSSSLQFLHACEKSTTASATTAAVATVPTKDTSDASAEANGGDAPVDPHPSDSSGGAVVDNAMSRQHNIHNRYQEIVPARIREEWKKAGRESAAIEGLSGVLGQTTLDQPHQRQQHALNTLVATAHITTTPQLSEESEDRRWTEFLDSANLLDEIRKDVIRTHPDLFFFLEPEDSLGQRRYAALERILFVWATLNKGVRYVQGMNEIVGTIYYVLANDFNGEWACEAEPDTYFVFNALMEEMRDIFVPDLDHADTGIQGRLSNMQNLLALHDPEVRCHLEDCGIDASFYAIRWLTTLLSREFLLPDTIRLWDSMFASTHKENFLRYVCVTMVMMVREELLKGDFSTCLRLLQSYPSSNIDHLLESSRALWIYESQITLACHKGGISLHQALQTIVPPPTLIMAYGLRGGVAVTHLEQLEQAAKELASSVRDASNAVSQGFFGGARRFFFRPHRNRSSGSVSSRDSMSSSVGSGD